MNEDKKKMEEFRNLITKGFIEIDLYTKIYNILWNFNTVHSMGNRVRPFTSELLRSIDGQNPQLTRQVIQNQIGESRAVEAIQRLQKTISIM